jgi:uncharacterized protein (TIGR03437 family)
VKRIFLLSSILAILSIVASIPASRAQQTPTDEVSLQLLPVPPNVIGTDVRGVSNDGKRIVFDSINDYNGRNVDSNKEIYVYDVDARSIIQITDTQDIKDPEDSTKTLFRINNETPVISGDGTKIAFVSNADFGDAKNEDRNYEVFIADLPRNSTEARISRITDTDKNDESEVVKEIFNNYTPAISDNGSVIAFVSTRQNFKAIPNGPQAFTVSKEGPVENPTDPDGNGELFLYDVANRRYTQVTVSRDVDATKDFVVRGFNSNPHLSGNGRVLAFLSGFNYAGANANKNSDFNGEIFIYRVGDPSNTFRQVTETSGNSAVPPNGVMNLLPAFTHPLSADGTRLVFESAGDLASKNSDKTREVFLADLGGASPTFRQITDQGTVDITKNDFNFFPSINSTGTFITFTSVLNLTPASSSSVKTDNADGSREVFRYDIAASKFRQITFAPLATFVFDQRNNTTEPFVDDSGNRVTFSFTANLVAPKASAIEDLFQALIRPVTATNSEESKLANAASFDSTQLARGSIAAAFGTRLANATVASTSANLPFELGGVTLAVNGLAARLIFVSSGQINFVIPNEIDNGDSVDFTINNNGVQSAGKVKIIDAAPGVFTTTGDGKGATTAQCGRVSPDGLGFLTSPPPCAVGNESQADLLIIYGTGWRNAAGIQVMIGDQSLTPSFAGPQPDFLGLDQINVNLTKELAGKTDLDVTVIVPAATNIESNKSKTSFKPFEEAITVLNGASFDALVVARGSVAVAQGMGLSNETASAAGPDFPLVLNGVRVTVADMPARLSFVSPAQVNFILPNDVKPAELVEVVVNNNGTISRGRVKVQDASPGIFTTTGDGNGSALARCGRVNADGSITFSDPPCSIGTEANPNIVRIFGTGWRFAESVKLKIGDTELTPTFAGAQPTVGGSPTPGIDIIEAKLVGDLSSKTDVDVIITATSGGMDFPSKAGIKISFTSNVSWSAK